MATLTLGTYIAQSATAIILALPIGIFLYPLFMLVRVQQEILLRPLLADRFARRAKSAPS